MTDTAIATLVGVSLDCADLPTMTAFYRDLTGWTVEYSDDDFAYMGGEGAVKLGLVRVDDYTPPNWPDGDKQAHLEFQVADLDQAEQRLLALGASKPDFQPGADKWHVLTDPAGHPFCISRET